MFGIDVMGAANLIVAIIDQAERDAQKPKLCSPSQRDHIRADAIEFMAMIDQIRADLVQDVIIPYRRRPGGGLRWEFNETEHSRRQRRNRQ